jgi:hypothetical protein
MSILAQKAPGVTAAAMSLTESWGWGQWKMRSLRAGAPRAPREASCTMRTPPSFLGVAPVAWRQGLRTPGGGATT